MTSPAIAPMDVDTAIADAANAAIASVAPDTDTTPASPNAAPPTSASAPTAADVDDDPLADEVDATDADAETEPSEADAVTLPEGFVVVEPVVEGLVTDFTLKDADGDELEIPALIVEYKANGKVRTDRLDQVVKLAQFGVYNQEREQRVQVVEQEAREVLDRYLIKSRAKMPIIHRTDIQARWLGLRQGDIVRITRHNDTSGEYYYYRCCM